MAGWLKINRAISSLTAAVSAAGFFRNFRLTGGAPCCKKIQHHHLSLVPGKECKDLVLYGSQPYEFTKNSYSLGIIIYHETA